MVIECGDCGCKAQEPDLERQIERLLAENKVLQAGLVEAEKKWLDAEEERDRLETRLCNMTLIADRLALALTNPDEDGFKDMVLDEYQFAVQGGEATSISFDPSTGKINGEDLGDGKLRPFDREAKP